MTRALFVIIGEKGHIHPFLGPAAELQSRGVEVAFYAPVDVRRALARAGFEGFYGGGEAVSGPPSGNRGAEFASLVADPTRLRAWIKTVLVDVVPGQIEQLTAVVRTVRPHLLVIDPMMYAGAIVAGREGLPWAGLSTSLNPVVAGDDMPSALLETTRALDPARHALFRAHALSARFRVCDVLSPYLTACFSTPALVGAPPPDVKLVGPSWPRRARGDEPAFAWTELDGRPLVSMSFGSQIFHQPALFRLMAEATVDLGIQLLCSVGSLDLGPLPAHVVTVPYFPQLEVLARSAVFVTHGGANSVMEASTLGVPMLVSPLCNDQFHNAAFVSRAGTGATLDLAAASPAEVRTVLIHLLRDPGIRERAAEMATSYRAHDGSARAADELMRWLT
jgi:zeaxanthin glucosyltransferase